MYKQEIIDKVNGIMAKKAGIESGVVNAILLDGSLKSIVKNNFFLLRIISLNATISHEPFVSIFTSKS